MVREVPLTAKSRPNPLKAATAATRKMPSAVPTHTFTGARLSPASKELTVMAKLAPGLTTQGSAVTASSVEIHSADGLR